MKVCFKCSVAKPPEEFYRHPMMADGRLGKCKDCTRKDTTANRQAKLEHYRSYDRLRAAMPHRMALNERVQKEWRTKHPERRRAQNALNNAIRDGRITAQPCLICGAKAESHHPDYSMPLDVVWLCSAHHKQAHVMAKAA